MAHIEGEAVKRQFRIPLETFNEKLVSHPTPKLADDAFDLPEGILDALLFAAPFVGDSRQHGPHRAFIDYVHIAGSEVFATDGQSIVAYDLGKAEMPWVSVTPKHIKMVRAFGEPPTRLAVEREPVDFDPPKMLWEAVQFEWDGGPRLSFGHAACPKPIADFREVFDEHNWADLHSISDNWRKQVVGHFSYKVIRENDGLLYISPGVISGGVFDGLKYTELEIETFVESSVIIDKVHFLRAIKTATAIKFEAFEGFHRMLFSAPNVRGVVTTRKPLPRPVQ